MFSNLRKLKRYCIDNPAYLPIYKLTRKLDKDNATYVLQLAIGEQGYDIVVDGLIGRGTINKMALNDPDMLLSTMNRIKDKRITLPAKDLIMNYLAREEGLHLHYNRGEKSYTTPYGVYAHANRESEVIQYVDALIQKLYIAPTRANMKAIDDSFTLQDDKMIRDLAYKLYMRKYAIPAGLPPHSALTAFSISVNGGKSRAIRAINSIFGSRSKHLLFSTIDSLHLLTDEYINKSLIGYMQGFYDNLIKNRPSKFARFKNGWANRLARLKIKKDDVA